MIYTGDVDVFVLSPDIFASLLLFFSRFICVYRLKINWSSVIEAYTFRMCVKIHRLKSLLCSMMPNLYHNTYTSTQESASRAIEIEWNVYTTIIDSDSDWVKNLIFEYTQNVSIILYLTCVGADGCCIHVHQRQHHQWWMCKNTNLSLNWS